MHTKTLTVNIVNILFVCLLVNNMNLYFFSLNIQ